jgi:hypothetical protein
VYKNYPASFEGVVQSFCERYSEEEVAEVKTEWESTWTMMDPFSK